MNNSTARLTLVSAMISGSVLAGCAESVPPVELVNARTAYHEAEGSQASQLAPAAMQQANVALDKAERAYENDAESAKTRDVSYVAQRRAQLAKVEATTVAMRHKQQQLESDRREHAAEQAQSLQGELDQTQQQLEADRREHAAEQAQSLQGELDQTQQQLEQERKAREQAEARTRDALSKLALASSVAVKQEPRGTVLTLPSSVLFASGKSDVLPGAQARLNQIASALTDDENHRVLVEGHTDSRGSDEKNQELSQARAESVRDYLVSRGLDADRVRAEGVGSSRPTANNDTATGRATNRRVEIVVEPIEPH